MAEELRRQVDSTMQKMGVAGAAGLPFEVYLHRRRLQELLDAAQDLGAAVDGWVDPAGLSSLTLVEG